MEIILHSSFKVHIVHKSTQLLVSLQLVNEGLSIITVGKEEGQSTSF